jgi:hypothetical protein
MVVHDIHYTYHDLFVFVLSFVTIFMIPYEGLLGFVFGSLFTVVS